MDIADKCALTERDIGIHLIMSTTKFDELLIITLPSRLASALAANFSDTFKA